MTARSFFAVWFILLALLSYGFFVYNLALDDLAGGHSWKQGDWLINSVNGPVRRSLTGDVAIWIGDALSVDLIRIVVVAQVAIVAVLYGLTLRIVFATGGVAIFILALSPAFFMTFWTADPLGSARKEMATFIALLLFALGTLRNGKIQILLGCLVFLLSVAAHEAMIVFTPLFWGIMVLGRSPHSNAKFQVITLGVATLTAGAILATTYGASQSDSLARVCQPLLDRGVQEHMCYGAIQWLDFDLSYGVEFVSSRTTLDGMLVFVLTYVLCLLPFLYVAYLSNARRLCALLIAAPLPLFLPLFFIATDHGRWISFHVFSSFVLFAVAATRGGFEVVRCLNPVILGTLLLVSLLFAPTHIRDVYLGGAIRKTVEEIGPHFRS